MSGVDAEHGLQVAPAEDQQPVQTLGADGVDHLDPLALTRSCVF